MISMCFYVHVCSYDRGTTYNVFVGRKKLIAGMDKALEGMCVNERWTIKVPPHLAYGKNGYGKSKPLFLAWKHLQFVFDYARTTIKHANVWTFGAYITHDSPELLLSAWKLWGGGWEMREEWTSTGSDLTKNVKTCPLVETSLVVEIMPSASAWISEWKHPDVYNSTAHVHNRLNLCSISNKFLLLQVHLWTAQCTAFEIQNTRFLHCCANKASGIYCSTNTKPFVLFECSWIYDLIVSKKKLNMLHPCNWD